MSFGRLFIVIHVPRDALADAVELQHVVAEAHRQQASPLLVLFKFLAWRLSIQSEIHANGHLAVPPELEQGWIVGGKEIISAGINEAGHSEPVQFAEEEFCSFDFIFR